MAVQFASQILPIDRSEPEASLGMTWASLDEGGISDMGYGKVYMTFGCHGVASWDECIDGGVSF